MEILKILNQKTLFKTFAVTPSALLLSLFFAEQALDFLVILILSWVVTFVFVTYLSEIVGSLRHFFTILGIFIVDTLWGLVYLFPLPDFSHESPFLLLLILLMLTVIMMACIICCTFLYKKIEYFLLKLA